MKKFFSKIIVLFICLVMLIPRNVIAAKVSSARISGVDSVSVGKSITIPFYINLSGVSMSDVNSFGVMAMMFELKFDDDIFSITNVSSKGFKSTIYKENNEYAVVSMIDVNDTENKCVDGILYCGEYEVDVTFYVADTEEDLAIIKMGEVLVVGYQLKNGEYNLDDSIEIEDVLNKSKVLKITKTDEVVTEKPESIVELEKPNIDDTKIIDEINSKIQEEKVVDGKSTNTYLSSLDIKGYTIDFYKRDREYEIEVAKGVSSLEINAKLDDNKSVLEIIGADDFKKNNNKVVINVTSESGNKGTYVINIKEEKEHKNTKITKADIGSKVNSIFAKYKRYIIILGGVILLIIIIALIINKINDRKIDRKFDEF